MALPLSLTATMMKLSRSVGLYLMLWRSWEVDAFLSPSHRVSCPSFVANPKTLRFALVYGEDGDVLAGEEDTVAIATESSLPPDILESLTSKLTTTLLIRLGCGFAPPPYANTLHPNTVESATLVSVDPTGLEIAVAVPRDGTLVQVLVPVTFPTPYRDDDDLQTLLDSIQQLDVQATERIGDSERNQDNYEELADQQRKLQALKEEPYADELPDWWTWPELNLSLEEECKSMKGLLNEDDFACDLKTLCQANTSERRIVQACVAAVGPSGIFLRARAESQTNGDAKEYVTAEVAVPFPSEARTQDTLRTAILDLVESAADLEEQPAVVVVPTDTDKEEVPIESVGMETQDAEGLLSLDETKEQVVAVAKSSPEDVQEEEPFSRKEIPTPEDIARVRKQPKSAEEEARLASKYAAIDDLGERAFTILTDLYMVL